MGTEALYIITPIFMATAAAVVARQTFEQTSHAELATTRGRWPRDWWWREQGVAAITPTDALRTAAVGVGWLERVSPAHVEHGMDVLQATRMLLEGPRWQADLQVIFIR